MRLDDRYGKTIYLDEYFSKPGEVNINLPADTFDKLVYQLLLWLHSNTNIIKLITEKTEQQFHGNPDQYVKALAFLLKNCRKDLTLIQVDLFEIEDPHKTNFNIVAAKAEPKNMILNFNPDSILLVKHKEKSHLIDCKSFFIDKNKLRSTLSSEYHINLTPDMKIPHFTDNRKSGLFLEKFYDKELLFVNPNINFDEFFIIRKEKNSRTCYYKAYQRTQLL